MNKEVDVQIMGTTQHRQILDKLYPINYSLEEKRELVKKEIIESLTVDEERSLVINKLLSYENDLKKEKRTLYHFNYIAGEKICLSFGKFDITRLTCDAIVNPINENGLGCFSYGCKCLDNQIHHQCGPYLRRDCIKILGNKKVKTSEAFMTKAYNLPCKNIIHCLGPIYSSSSSPAKELQECYLNILNLADENNLISLALCGISTGLYGYPKNEAIKIMTTTVVNWVNSHPITSLKIIMFCVYDQDSVSGIVKNLMQMEIS